MPIWRRTLTATLACCLALAAVLVTAGPAHATQFLAWEDGAGFATFGPNEAVMIDVGAVQYIRGCEEGVDDFVYPFADVYVMVGTPGIGATLYDHGGTPNPVGGTALSGAFVNQLLGVTAPSGAFGAHTYTVVYDECQDGTLGPEDAVFEGAFQVVLTADVPPLPPQIGAMKTSAREQARTLATASVLLGGVLAFHNAKSVKDLMLQFLKPDAADIGLMALEKLAGYVTGVSPEDEAAATMLNAVSQWLAIAEDPPDPDFQQMTLLPPVQHASASVTRPADAAIAAYGAPVGSEAALAEALLHALERYQGAQAAGNGEWSLVQAQAIRTYATLLADHALIHQAAIDTLGAGLTAHSEDYDAAELEARRVQVVNAGFTPDQLQALRNFDLSNREIAELRAGLGTTTYSSYEKSAALQALAEAKNAQVAARSSMLALAGQMQAIITQLEAQPAVVGGYPTADAGGPYAATAGITLTLSGAATAVDGRTLQFAWDLNGDSQFDDGAGAQPEVNFPAAFSGYIGLLVTDNTGRQAVDYAPVAVTGGNRPPIIASVVPTDTAALVVRAGTDFRMDAADPDSDNVTLLWLLDGAVVGQGASYPYSANSPGHPGLHRLQAIADDGKPGGITAHSWDVIALGYDSDADGWYANIDCQDSAFLVHPGASEVVGNGIDDDCNPRSTDAGVVLPPDLYVVTKLVDTADGVCDTDCSLREAVLAANQSSEQAITIQLGPGVYSLSIPGGSEQQSATGDLDLAPVAGQTFTITGQGAAATSIDATGLQDRVLDVRSGAVIVEKLTIRGVDTSMSTADSVGAIFVKPGDVGPIWETDYALPRIPPTPTELTVRDAVMTDNKTSFGGGAIGASRGTARITVVRSQLVNNTTDGLGGAIFTNGYGQVITLEDSLVQGNRACFAGAIVKAACPGWPDDLIVLRNTQVVSNVASLQTGRCDRTLIAKGGAIVADHLLAINSTIDYNSASDWGGGIAQYGCSDNAKFRLVNSSVSYNRLTRDDNQSSYGLFGAGIYGESVPIEAENSVISGNQAPAAAGGVIGASLLFTNTVVSHNAGAGLVWAAYSPAPNSILNSTIHSNQGWGLAPSGTEPLLVANSIIAGNQNGNCAPNGAPVHSLGYNLSDDDTCALLGTADMTGTNPLLTTALVDGVQQTNYRLQPSSPAIDRAGSVLCPADAIDGVQRPQAAGCDIGAWEYTPASILRFARPQVRVAAGAAAVNLTVERVGDTLGEVTINYATDDATAKAGVDYVAAAGTLTFAAGDTSQVLQLKLLQPGALVDARSFVVALRSPTGGAQLAPVSQAAVTIENRGEDLYLPLLKR
jgi:CSLREA domain-containing protein